MINIKSLLHHITAVTNLKHYIYYKLNKLGERIEITECRKEKRMYMLAIQTTQEQMIIKCCYRQRNGEFQKAKSPTLSNRASLNRSLAMSYSHMGPPTLPSALTRFT
ncbi:hypothetical protein, partial [Thalassomonas sp. RHCl1]|uniref:hypothetical protein n=1 Tax=Thalassomonas sp. RHCl1 TaxID=2995320 RepID=UPI00248AEC44